jgi:hypothetical protein
MYGWTDVHLAVASRGGQILFGTQMFTHHRAVPGKHEKSSSKIARSQKNKYIIAIFSKVVETVLFNFSNL